MRQLVMLIAVGLALGACSEPSTGEGSGSQKLAETVGESSVHPASPTHGKRVAPVEIRSSRGDELGAAVEIVFGADASQVMVRIYGVDGLRVLGEEYPIREGAYRRGETTTFDVRFDPRTAPGMLAVRVDGTFEGRPGFRTVTFTIGGREREVHAPNPNVIEAGDQRLHVTPAVAR